MDKVARMLWKKTMVARMLSKVTPLKIFDACYSAVMFGCPAYYICRTLPLITEGVIKDSAAKKVMFAPSNTSTAEDEKIIAEYWATVARIRAKWEAEDSAVNPSWAFPVLNTCNGV